MANRIKVALVGLGSVAQRGILPHLACEDAQQKVETVACVDPVPGRAAETAKRYGWREPYTDYDEMLRHADVEAVLLATPIPLHYSQAMAALGAGKHVYVQKAMSTTVREATDIVTAAAKAQRVLVASPGQMLRPIYQAARRLITGGTLGRLYWALSNTSGAGHEQEQFRRGDDVLSNVDPRWYYQPGGGPVYDMAVYALHAITGMLGPAKQVTALSGIGLPVRTWKGQQIPVEMDDNTIMLLDFGNNLYATIGGHNSVAPPSIPFGQIFCSGTGGSMSIGNGGINLISGNDISDDLLRGLREAAQTADSDGGRRTSMRYEAVDSLPHVVGEHTHIPESHVYADIMHLVDCIDNSAPVVASGQHALHVVEIIEQAYVASKTGHVQTVSSTF